jgi:hypothetical protein
MRIAFSWTGGIKNRDRFDRWNDGLRAAMRLIEAEHEVTYHEPDEDIPTVDWILYWEAPLTYASDVHGSAYKKLMNQPQKKALFFAGGPIKREWVAGFNHIFVESGINETEFAMIDMPYSRAFGVNTDVFKPLNLNEEFTTVTHGTCAGWKRQQLIGEALGEKALVFGQNQEADPAPFQKCREFGATVLPEQTYEETNRLLNIASVGVNCANHWGGGQRATLECMAAGRPVIVMSDSVKNREFVEESGVGIVSDTSVPSIRITVQDLVSVVTPQMRQKAVQYVQNKWTHHHYRDAILNRLCQI